MSFWKGQGVSPRRPDPTTRRTLVEAAARLLVHEGASALTVRRLTREAGTSTIAVYTYFEGIEDLRRVVAVEGFSRLSGRVAALPPTDDPVADLAVMGDAYLRFGMDNPDFYRFIFGEQPVAPEAGTDAFHQLLAGAERAIRAGRFRDDAAAVATQLWVTVHGITSLHLASLLTADQASATLTQMGSHLFVGFGDHPEAVRAAIDAATDRIRKQDSAR